MNDNPMFFGTDPLKGAKTARRTGYKVDANGVPLDELEKQKQNNASANDPNDITNNPMFKEMFGDTMATKVVTDPLKKGNVDRWIPGESAVQRSKTTTEKKEYTAKDIPIEQVMVPSADPNDITNNSMFKEMFGEETNTTEQKEENDESEINNISDSHTMK